jgi:protein-S-isoprenylcysteine O-methyltransferase Ste14
MQKGENAVFVGVYQSAVTLLLATAFYAVDVALMRRFDPLRSEGSSRSWSWTFFAMIMALIVVLQPVVWPELGWYVDAWWGLAIQVLGLLLISGGLALHWWARLHLRQFYGERIELQPEQHLVETGPYTCVRHPIYASFFLCSGGLLLVNPALTTLTVAAYFFWDFSRAALREEVVLQEKLPGYVEYMARVPRYFPRFQRSPGS